MTDDERKIIDYASSFPGAYLDYPFHDDIAALRHRQNKKTFVFIIKRGSQLWVNLKCDPMKAGLWRGAYPAVTKGYHMNDKAAWNTVIMDGTVPWGVMEEMISDSYDITKPRTKK